MPDPAPKVGKSGSGVKSGGSGSTTLHVTLVSILGGEELVGNAQLPSYFFIYFVDFCQFIYVGSGSGMHSGFGSCGSGSGKAGILGGEELFHNNACKAGILGGEELVGDAQLSTNFWDLLTCQFILCRIRIQIRIQSAFRFHNTGCKAGI
jgi:hypothetical protein